MFEKATESRMKVDPQQNCLGNTFVAQAILAI